jgi:hypothetical protein
MNSRGAFESEIDARPNVQGAVPDARGGRHVHARHSALEHLRKSRDGRFGGDPPASTVATIRDERRARARGSRDDDLLQIHR